MGLDEELESMEESGETEAEAIDEQADLEEQLDDDMLEGEGDEEEPFLTRENLEQTKDDLNDIYQEGAALASELKDAFADIKEGLNLGSFFK